jgi:DNA segregation ATPase FtsK/SpoIIIE-like protein
MPKKKTDTEIKDFIKTSATQNKNISVEFLRNYFSIGYRRAKKLRDESVEENDIDVSGNNDNQSSLTTDKEIEDYIEELIANQEDLNVEKLRTKLRIGYKRAQRYVNRYKKQASKKKKEKEENTK